MIKYLKSKIAVNNTNTMLNLANTAVTSAAQIGDIGNLTDVERKAKAVDILKSLLSVVGLEVPEFDISNLIEAAYRCNNSFLE